MRTIIVFLTLLLAPQYGIALDFQHRDTVLLTDINGDPGGRLGWAVGVNQGSVFMGAPEQDLQEGATYVYRIDANRKLVFDRELVTQSESPFLYGQSMVTDGDVAAVGYGVTDLIELYLRSGNDWVLSKVLEPPVIDGVTIRAFGKYMDLEGDFLVVGDPTANVGADSNAGIVMIFARHQGGANNWGMVVHFLDTDPPESPEFARTVAISSDLMLAGDPESDRVLLYLRTGNSWAFAKQLQPQDVQVDDRFGFSVAAEGDYIAVGASNGNEVESPSNSGSVHIFQRNEGGLNSFGQITQLYPSAPKFVDRFGTSLRLRDGLLVVGAPGKQQVYVFARFKGFWTEEQLLLPPANLEFGNAEFGWDVDYHEGSLVVGSNRWSDFGGDRFGAVFLYEDQGTILCGKLNGIFCDSFEGDTQ